jgi:ABC-type nitrate/sulfonate/bicarbonate transport system ATPase subunit
MPHTGLVAGHAQRAVEAALADTRVVVLLGACQVGKSTLLEQVASLREPGARSWRTPVAIDEIQRVPELMTEIKLRRFQATARMSLLRRSIGST